MPCSTRFACITFTELCSIAFASSAVSGVNLGAGPGGPANTYTGITTVNPGLVANGGYLLLNDSSALGAGGALANGTVVNVNSTLDLNGFSPINEVFTLNGNGSVPAGAFDQGALFNNGGAPVAASVLNGAVNLAGNTTIAAGFSFGPAAGANSASYIGIR